MKLEFDGDLRGGLRVVPTIPFARLGQLQGLNGTGKSLALRLAQLCANPDSNPYLANPDSWRSLRAGLADGYTVRAIDPESGEVAIEWRLQPSGWPESPAEFAYDDIGTVYVHGTAVAPSEYAASPSVEVVLFSGNESVLDVLRHMVAEDAELFRVQGDRVREALQSTQIELEQLHDVLEGARPDTQDTLRRQLEESTAQLEVLREALNTARQRRQALAELDDEERSLAAAEATVPQLLADRNGLQKRVDRLQEEEVGLDAEIRAALELRAELKQLETELNYWQRLYSKRTQFFAKSSARGSTLTGELGLPDDTSAVQAAEAETRQELGNLAEQHANTLRSVPLFDLARRMLEVLDTAELDDESELFSDESGVVTIRRLRAGLRQRRSELETMDHVARERQLASAIARSSERLEGLVGAGEALEDRDRKLDNLREAEEKLSDLVGQIDAGSPLGELTKQRSQVRDQLAQAIVELEQTHARLNALTAGRDLNQWRDALTQRREELDLSEPIDQELARADTEIGRRAHELAELEKQLVSIEQTLEAAKHRAKRASREVRDRGLDWIDVRSSEVIGRALDLVQELRGRTSRQGLMIAGFASALAELTQELGSLGRGGSWPDDPPTRALLGHYGERLTQLFAEDAMREALLEGGVPETVDLWQRTVRYRVDGEPHQRPLEAFSSGEMVFAYTRSRLALLDPPSVGRHRIVALDEFGAFLDQEKRDLLLRFLADEVVGKTADQIVLVLPAVDLTALGGESVRFDAISEFT